MSLFKKRKNLIVTEFNGKYTDSFGEGGVERGRKEGMFDFDLTEKPKGSSLVDHWLRIHASTTGNLGSAPGQGPTTCRAQPKEEKEKKKKTNRIFYFPHRKNSPAMQEILVGFLGWKDPLEKGQPTHSSILVLPWWLS